MTYFVSYFTLDSFTKTPTCFHMLVRGQPAVSQFHTTYVVACSVITL